MSDNLKAINRRWARKWASAVCNSSKTVSKADLNRRMFLLTLLRSRLLKGHGNAYSNHIHTLIQKKSRTGASQHQ